MVDASTGFYDGFVDFADEIVLDFSDGKTALITKTTGTVNGGAGEVTGQGTTTQTVPVVRLPATSSKLADLDIRNDLGSTVNKKLAFVLIAGKDLTFDLENNQVVTMDGEDWNIIGVTPVNPNVGNAILWKVALQR